MQTIQKLEIGAGIATSASIVFILLAFLGLALYEGAGTNTIFVVSNIIGYYGLFSMMVTGGAYNHVTKRSRVAPFAMALGAFVIIAVSLAIVSFSGGSHGGLTLVISTPAIFAFLTCFLALFPRD